jgi:hypothetical protein
MLEHVLGDNPSVDQQLAIIANSLSLHIVNEREGKEETRKVLEQLTKEVAALRLLQREQNGNVATALNKIREIENREEIHDKHHGTNDTNIGERLGVLEDDKSSRTKVLSLLQKEWHYISVSVASGLFIGKVLHDAGFFHLIGLE